MNTSEEAGTNIKAVDMRCRNCTTELWGNPTVCPVCGTPTGQRRRPPPPTNAAPSAPIPPPPSRTPSGPFNAADLLDPEVLAGLPGAETPASRRSGALFDPAGPAQQNEEPPDWLNSPLPNTRTTPEPDQAARSSGMLNAADLFDPQVLSMLSFPGAAPEAAAPRNEPPAPPQGMFNAADLFDPEILAGFSFQGAEQAAPERGPTPEWEDPRLRQSPLEGPGPRQPSTAFGSPPTASRTSRGLGAPPFSLAPIAPDASEGYAPPERPGNTRPPRGSASHLNGAAENAAPVMPVPLSGAPPRGWRIVSDAPAPVRQSARKPSHPPIIAAQFAAAQATPLPAEQALKQRSRPAFTGLISLLLALTVLTLAALFGLYRYQQILSLQPTPVQDTSGTLPTVGPKPGYVIFPDSALAFSLQYPTAWKEQPDRDLHDSQYHGDLFSSGAYAGLEVGSSPKYNSWSPGQINNYVLAAPFALTNHEVSVQLSAPTSPTIHIAGLDWTAEDADVTFDTGVVVHMTSLSIIHQGRGYNISYWAVQEQFSFYSNNYYEPMLLSFRFLG